MWGQPQPKSNPETQPFQANRTNQTYIGFQEIYCAKPEKNVPHKHQRHTTQSQWFLEHLKEKKDIKKKKMMQAFSKLTYKEICLIPKIDGII